MLSHLRESWPTRESPEHWKSFYRNGSPTSGAMHTKKILYLYFAPHHGGQNIGSRKVSQKTKEILFDRAPTWQDIQVPPGLEWDEKTGATNYCPYRAMSACKSISRNKANKAFPGLYVAAKGLIDRGSNNRSLYVGIISRIHVT